VTADLAVALPDVGVEWTTTRAAVVDPALPYEAFEALVSSACKMGDAARWWLGDLLNFGEDRYGEEAAQVLSNRLSERQVSEYRWVAKNVHFSVRTDELSFTHHRIVAALDRESQRRFLTYAAEYDLTVRELREALREAQALSMPREKEPSEPRWLVQAETRETVDAAANVVAVTKTLELIGAGITEEAAEAIGIGTALRAAAALGETVKKVAERPPLLNECEEVIKAATRSSGYAQIPEPRFDKFAAAVAAYDEGSEE
jgi:hypothetical protein